MGEDEKAVDITMHMEAKAAPLINLVHVVKGGEVYQLRLSQILPDPPDHGIVVATVLLGGKTLKELVNELCAASGYYPKKATDSPKP